MSNNPSNTIESKTNTVSWLQHLGLGISITLLLSIAFFLIKQEIWKFIILILICLVAIITDLNTKIESSKFYFYKIFIFLGLSLFINFLVKLYLNEYSDFLNEMILFLAGIAYLNVKKLYESSQKPTKQ